MYNVNNDNFALHYNAKKWNNFRLENLKFPLTHTKIVYKDKLVDNFLTDEDFSTAKLCYKIKNKIKNF